MKTTISVPCWMLVLLATAGTAVAAPAVALDLTYHVGAFPLQHNTQAVSIPAAVFDPNDITLLQGARVVTGALYGFSELELSGFQLGKSYDLELLHREDRQGLSSDFVQVQVNDVEIGKTYNGYAGWGQLDSNGHLQDGRYLRLRHSFVADAQALRIRVVASHGWWPGPAHGIPLAIRILGTPVEARIAPVGDRIVPWPFDVKLRPACIGLEPADDSEGHGHDGDGLRVKLEPAQRPAWCAVILDGSSSAGAVHYFWELEDELGGWQRLADLPVQTIMLGPGCYRAKLQVDDGVHLSAQVSIAFCLRLATPADILEGPLTLAGIPLEARRFHGRSLHATLNRAALIAALGPAGEHQVQLAGVGQGATQVCLRAPHEHSHQHDHSDF